jgi:hypothetical protein
MHATEEHVERVPPHCNRTFYHRCPYDANLTQTTFFSIYDHAIRVVRQAQPRAKIVAPSIADGGPGINGWSDVLPWLQAFLLHANASGTLPDVLCWHVSNIGSNGSMLVSHSNTYPQSLWAMS